MFHKNRKTFSKKSSRKKAFSLDFFGGYGIIWYDNIGSMGFYNRACFRTVKKDAVINEKIQ